MLRNITETRKSKRRRNMSPDNLSSGDVQQLASQTKSRSLLSLLSTGGHGGRLWAESNPSQEWRLAGAPSEVSCAPHGAASTSLGTPPNVNPHLHYNHLHHRYRPVLEPTLHHHCLLLFVDQYPQESIIM